MQTFRLRERKRHDVSAPALRIKSSDRIESWELVFVALLFLAALLLRLWGVSKIHSWDEMVIVYRQAEEPAQSDVAWCDATHKFVRLAAYPTMVVFRRL